MGRGSNLSRLGDFNQTVVFDAIRRTPGGTSRVELVAETRLTAQTVSNIVRRLLAHELIVESGRVQSAVRGKPRTLLRVEPSARFAIGVHVDPATLTYVLIDIEGRVRQYARRRTLLARRPEQVVAAIADQVTQLVTAAGIRPAAVLGLGVAAPGPLDVVEGVLLKPPQLAGWEKVRLRADLHAATGLHVLVDKDVTAAATGERWAQEGPAPLCLLLSGLRGGSRGGDGRRRAPGCQQQHRRDRQHHCRPRSRGPRGWPARHAGRGVPSPSTGSAGARRGLITSTVSPDDFVAVDEVFTTLCERAYAGEAACS
jgi:hypothetical protein